MALKERGIYFLSTEKKQGVNHPGLTWCPKCKESKLLLSVASSPCVLFPALLHGPRRLLGFQPCYIHSPESRKAAVWKKRERRGGKVHASCLIKMFVRRWHVLCLLSSFLVKTCSRGHPSTRRFKDVCPEIMYLAKYWGLIIMEMEGMDIGRQLAICHTRPLVKTFCCEPSPRNPYATWWPGT